VLDALQPAQRERGRQQFGTQRRSDALQCQAGLVGISIREPLLGHAQARFGNECRRASGSYFRRRV